MLKFNLGRFMHGVKPPMKFDAPKPTVSQKPVINKPSVSKSSPSIPCNDDHGLSEMFAVVFGFLGIIITVIGPIVGLKLPFVFMETSKAFGIILIIVMILAPVLFGYSPLTVFLIVWTVFFFGGIIVDGGSDHFILYLLLSIPIAALMIAIPELIAFFVWKLIRKRR